MGALKKIALYSTRTTTAGGVRPAQLKPLYPHFYRAGWIAEKFYLSSRVLALGLLTIHRIVMVGVSQLLTPKGCILVTGVV